MRPDQSGSFIANLKELIAEFDERAQVIHGCSDGWCLVSGKAKGMHTNGGCCCWQDRMKAQIMMRVGRRMRDRLASITAVHVDGPDLRKDITALVDWVQHWVLKMHRDISDRERAKLADEMCCEWASGGMGAAYEEFGSDHRGDLSG